ncbi:hypothetical protein FB451DRAFT_1366953 [Mycena latifolia]|nr:hypothetical protein FB451DRAFT_1366953 [Mycena latifolia]
MKCEQAHGPVKGESGQAHMYIMKGGQAQMYRIRQGRGRHRQDKNITSTIIYVPSEDIHQYEAVTFGYLKWKPSAQIYSSHMPKNYSEQEINSKFEEEEENRWGGRGGGQGEGHWGGEYGGNDETVQLRAAMKSNIKRSYRYLVRGDGYSYRPFNFSRKTTESGLNDVTVTELALSLNNRDLARDECVVESWRRLVTGLAPSVNLQGFSDWDGR